MFHSKTGIQSQPFDAKLNHWVRMLCPSVLRLVWWGTVSTLLTLFLSPICFHSVFSIVPFHLWLHTANSLLQTITTAQLLDVLLSLKRAGHSALPSRTYRNQMYKVINWNISYSSQPSFRDKGPGTQRKHDLPKITWQFRGRCKRYFRGSGKRLRLLISYHCLQAEAIYFFFW